MQDSVVSDKPCIHCRRAPAQLDSNYCVTCWDALADPTGATQARQVQQLQRIGCGLFVIVVIIFVLGASALIREALSWI